MVCLQEKRDMLDAASSKLSKALRCELAEIVQSFEHQFNVDNAAICCNEIESNPTEFSSPIQIIDAVQQARLEIRSLLDEASEFAKSISEENAYNVVVRNSALLGRLIPIRADIERPDNPYGPWDAKEATERLHFILFRFESALKHLIFDADNARAIFNEITAADEDYKALRDRLEYELPDRARLHMSTIASSFRIMNRAKNYGNSDSSKKSKVHDDLADTFGALELPLDDNKPAKETICIFDESGCIPIHELLRLSILGRSIKSIIVVGDKSQLQPYDSSQGNSYQPLRGTSANRDNRFGFASNSRWSRTEKLLSVLDASALTIHSGKVVLNTQYKIPKDIAAMLNKRVYRGQCKTCPNAKVPVTGWSITDFFHLVVQLLFTSDSSIQFS